MHFLKKLFFIKQANAPKSRITTAEAPVVQKLNQGTIPQSGCNPCRPDRRGLRGPFFGCVLSEVEGWASKKVTPACRRQ